MELGLFYEFCPLLSQVSNSSPLQTHYPHKCDGGCVMLCGGFAAAASEGRG